MIGQIASNAFNPHIVNPRSAQDPLGSILGGDPPGTVDRAEFLKRTADVGRGNGTDDRADQNQKIGIIPIHHSDSFQIVT